MRLNLIRFSLHAAVDLTWAKLNLIKLNFIRRDLRHKNAKFGLVKFGVVWCISLRKKQPFGAVFYFVVKGGGEGLNGAPPLLHALRSQLLEKQLRA